MNCCRSAMLCTVVLIATLAASLTPASSHSTRLQWVDPEDLPSLESADEPTWRLPTKRELGDGKGLLYRIKLYCYRLNRQKPVQRTNKVKVRNVQPTI